MPQKEQSAPQPSQRAQRIIQGVGGVMGGLFAFWLGILFSNQTINVRDVQITFQTDIALLMFGYYVSYGRKKNQPEAYFLALFLATVLTLSVIFSYTRLIVDYPSVMGVVGAIGFGLYLGATRISETRLNKSLRGLVNGGGWIIQLTGTPLLVRSVNFDFTAPIIVIEAIAVAIIAYRKWDSIKEWVKDIFGKSESPPL